MCHESLLTSFIMLFAWLFEHSLVPWYQPCVTLHYVPKCMSYHGAIGGLVITGRVHCLSFWLHIYILRPSFFCGIWALCVSWVTSNQFLYAPCLKCWALFGSLVPTMCNRTSYAQVHELPWGHWWIGNNREGRLSVFLTTCIYYVHLISVGFEHSVCHF